LPCIDAARARNNQAGSLRVANDAWASDNQADKVSHFMAHGYVRKAVEAAERHPGSPDVLEQVMCSLHNAASSGGRVPGAALVAVAAMNAFLRNQDIQVRGCRLLGLPDLEGALDAGGLNAVICAMEAHPGSAEVQSAACAALRVLLRLEK
jgi:hypothetical protein